MFHRRCNGARAVTAAGSVEQSLTTAARRRRTASYADVCRDYRVQSGPQHKDSAAADEPGRLNIASVLAIINKQEDIY
jgi:hypothetical protein